MKVKPENVEQEICVDCGFCCDGTLFHYAVTKDKSHPLFHIEEVDGKNRFRQPCHLFKDGCCSIYDQKRPTICGEFKCKLLRRVNAGAVSQSEAVGRVYEAKKLKEEIFDELRALNYDVSIGFNQSIKKFKEDQLQKLTEADFNKKFAKLLVKHQLLNEYLKKHFKKNENKKKTNVDA